MIHKKDLPSSLSLKGNQRPIRKIKFTKFLMGYPVNG